MNTPIKTTRIESIDLLRGIVMILMALDHSRDYFHYGALASSAVSVTDPATTTPILYFTRYITHFCAPTFVFLAGTSAYLYGTKKREKELSWFLFSRGLWLIIIEVTINNFLWWFDIHIGIVHIQVLWAIGFSMILLSMLIYLPIKIILGLGLFIVAGHNLLDGITAQGSSFGAIIWYLIHQASFVPISPNRFLMINYPVLAWLGIMLLGYCLGTLYQRDFDAEERKKWLVRLGGGALFLFFIIRGINVYGDLAPWSVQKNMLYTAFSFFNVSKYPPSLDFILITLGVAVLSLAFLENAKNRLTQFIITYGRVPFFYYLMHILFIHGIAVLILVILGKDFQVMILTPQIFTRGVLATYGYALWITYLLWISIVLLLYPLCHWFMQYKAKNREKWWLSYL